MYPSRTAISVAVATLIVLPTLVGPDLAHPAGRCDDHVRREGRTFRVLPTDADDTHNLQCAFDEATHAGPGATVRLVEGTYVTRQIVIRDFHGTLRGDGADERIVTNPEEPMPVAKTAWFLAPPSPEQPWPMLFSVLHSAMRVSDATFRIRGAAPLSCCVPGARARRWTAEPAVAHALARDIASRDVEASAPP